MVEKYSEFKNGILIAGRKELELIDKGIDAGMVKTMWQQLNIIIKLSI